MIEAPALKFALRNPDGTRRELSVDSDSARIGSGAHCEIRLSGENIAVEQLEVCARSEGVFAQARSLHPPVLLNGVPFVQGRLLPESSLRVGDVEISVTLVERYGSTNTRASERRRSRAIYLLGGIGIPLGILLLALEPQAQAARWNIEPQPLWPKEERVSCPQNDVAAAAALADKEKAQGETARERAPFSPQDGVLAVEHFARAAACYSVARARPELEAARRSASELKRSLEQQFHVHQVRLERALVTERYDEAKKEIRILLSFAGRRSGALFDWLATLDRQLDLKFLGKKS